MTTQEQFSSLNGAASLYLMIGRLTSNVEHLEKTLETGLHDVNVKVDRLERTVRMKREPRAWMSSLSSLGLTGKELIILAIAASMGATGTLTPETFRALLLGH
jgi:hypothetical protein